MDLPSAGVLILTEPPGGPALWSQQQMGHCPQTQNHSLEEGQRPPGLPAAPQSLQGAVGSGQVW